MPCFVRSLSHVCRKVLERIEKYVVQITIQIQPCCQEVKSAIVLAIHNDYEHCVHTEIQ